MLYTYVQVIWVIFENNVIFVVDLWELYMLAHISNSILLPFRKPKEWSKDFSIRSQELLKLQPLKVVTAGNHDYTENKLQTIE